MQVIVLAIQKGGAGKSTIARLLAVELAGQGGKVAMLDLDRQGTVTKWWRRRQAEDLQLIEGIQTIDQIPQAIENLRQDGFDWLIIDTPGKEADAATMAAMRAASLVIVPLHHSQDDLEAAENTMAEIQEAAAPFIFVLSRTARARIADEAVRTIASYGRVAPVNISARVAHSEATGPGLTAPELGNAVAANEVKELVKYVRGVVS